MEPTALIARVRDALADVREAEDLAKARREDLAQAVADATTAGVPQKDLIAATGLSRERVRQLTRAGGVGGQDNG